MIRQTLSLTLKSMVNRRLTTCLTVFSVSCSIALLLAVRKVKDAARASFESTISDVDLILGARSSDISLMLYSVFRVGNATNNITWQSYQDIVKQEEVAWQIPLQLGDSHRGYRVLGTNLDYFKYFKYGRGKALQFQSGSEFSKIDDIVLGSEVAKNLNYQIGSKINLSHGTGSASFQDHKEIDFVVKGILQPTGTPVDRTVHTSLEAIEAMHIGWETGAPPLETKQTDLHQVFPVTQITSALIGLKQKNSIFKLQRYINEYEEEPLQGVLPGVAFSQLWNIVGVIETALNGIAYLVFGAGLIGMVTALLTSLSERRREMAILRSLGASPLNILLLLMFESFILVSLACIVAVATFFVSMALFSPWLANQYGLHLELVSFTMGDLGIISVVIGLGVLAGLLPAFRAYMDSLSDGLTIRT